MDSNKKRRDEFIKELQSPLKSKSSKTKNFQEENKDFDEDEIQLALEAKFNELFGTLTEED